MEGSRILAVWALLSFRGYRPNHSPFQMDPWIMVGFGYRCPTALAEALSPLFRRPLGPSKADVGAKCCGVQQGELWLRRKP